jgi:hypothetical protein
MPSKTRFTQMSRISSFPLLQRHPAPQHTDNQTKPLQTATTQSHQQTSPTDSQKETQMEEEPASLPAQSPGHPKRAQPSQANGPTRCAQKSVPLGQKALWSTQNQIHGSMALSM